MARFVLKATKQHARNLAFFATIYKTLLIVQRRMHGKERPMDSFLAGLVGGYMVFGENNNVNQQVVFISLSLAVYLPCSLYKDQLHRNIHERAHFIFLFRFVAKYSAPNPLPLSPLSFFQTPMVRFRRQYDYSEPGTRSAGETSSWPNPFLSLSQLLPTHLWEQARRRIRIEI